MRSLALIVAMTGAALVGSTAANAMPVPSLAPLDGNLVQVSGGCGPGGHRTPYGNCAPNGYGYGRPVFRGCPPGFHPGGYSGRCRPNF